MPAQADAEAHYAQRQLLAATAATVATRQWATVDTANIGASWARHVPATVTAVTGAQTAAARTAQPYIALALSRLNAPPYELAADAFTGAADGRDLAMLLYQPVITALAAIKAGQPTPVALALGQVQLDTIVRTEVADAGRTADQVAATVHRAGGYIRLVVGATCNRCIILAGRVYPWSTGFLRHPRCDCVMIPVNDANTVHIEQSPERVYAAMTPEQRSRAGWSQAEQQAIADGADIAAVTNIHRGGLYVAGGRQYTYEAVRGRPRITPRQIYREARGDRAEAIRLLKLHHYIR